jgi:MFS superfamily sulfate permease-like transporter
MVSTVPDLNTGRMVSSTFGRMCCQMDVIRVEGSIFFGSAAFVLEDLQRRRKSHPNMACLLIRMHRVNNFDASGVHVLELIQDDVRRGALFLGSQHARLPGVQELGAAAQDRRDALPQHDRLRHPACDAGGVLPVRLYAL